MPEPIPMAKVSTSKSGRSFPLVSPALPHLRHPHSLTLPDISPHLYEDAYPPIPLAGLLKDPHAARRTSALAAVPPKEERQVHHPHALPRTTFDILEDERVRANQAENRADFNEIRLRELQTQVDIMEREVQSLRNSLNNMTRKKGEAERQASEAMKREQRLREYMAEEGLDEGGWSAREKNYDSVWHEGWAQGHEDGHKEGRLAIEKDYDAGWWECWPVAFEEGQKQGFWEAHTKIGRSEDGLASCEEGRRKRKLKGHQETRKMASGKSNWSLEEARNRSRSPMPPTRASPSRENSRVSSYPAHGYPA